MFQELSFGGVAERLKAAVLKTVRPQKGLVGSNPTPSAMLVLVVRRTVGCAVSTKLANDLFPSRIIAFAGRVF
jgi:hypothetical protein